MNKEKTVFVGLSGGVDSSVAALRLKKQGYTVVGVFIKVWHPDFMVCNWEQERLDAMRVAAHLDIPFLTCDAEDAYKQEVADYFIAEYKAGRTPNPDVMCNKAVKFGAFLEFAKARGADFVATGHYAQKVGGSLCRGVDEAKDQSYFLWTLTNEQLKYILLPIGSSEKAQIRAEAEMAGIPVASKKDSQGICFLGHVDIPEFLSHYIEIEPGLVLNLAGDTIGTHKGAIFYTLGQRHGFSLHTASTAQERQYVVARDIRKNTITVATQPPVLADAIGIQLDATVFRGQANPDKTYAVQFRYHGPIIPCRVAVAETSVILYPQGTVEKPASGQSAVLYDAEVCLGGGIIR